MLRREMESKRGRLPPKEGDLTCMSLVRCTALRPWVDIFGHIQSITNKSRIKGLKVFK